MKSSKKFHLLCKSYIGDLARSIKLWESIKKHNKELIPFWLCVPQADIDLFKLSFGSDSAKINWVTDEEIVLSGQNCGVDRYKTWDGRLSQQVIKSEFWRLFDGDITYLCIDSESQFIKDFYSIDFFNGETPYTIFHQNKELLQLAVNKKIDKVASNFFAESVLLKNIFNRTGPDYDFGPTPAIWSSKVWRSLDECYLKPNNMTFWDAIERVPSELRWYGESLLAYKAIPVYPIEPIFRVYHYDWQFFVNKRLGETVRGLSVNYLGVLKQSNWDYQNDYGNQANRKSFLSRLLRGLKRFLAQYR